VSAFTDGLREGWANTRRSARNAPATTRRVLRDPRSIVAGAPLAPLVVLYGHTLIDAVDRAGFNVILPEIKNEFGLDLQAASSIASVSILVALLLSVPVAFWSERTRHRTWFLAAGALIAGLFAGVSGLATGVALFVVARGAFGLGLRLNDPVQSSLMADYYAVNTRPTIFAGRSITQNVGQLAGPLFFGITAELFGWRAAVLAVALPSLALAVWSWRLREPVRGAPERAALGLTGADAEVEEEPPTFEEALQILRRVGTIRRLWHALPFLIGGLTSFAVLFPLYLEEVFGLGPAQRGVIGAINEPVGIVALLFAIPISVRYLQSGQPERLFRMLGVSSTVVAVSIGVMALAPNLAVLIAASLVLQAAAALLAPGVATLFAMITPPRVRTVGYAFGALWALPGLLMLPVAGGLGDALGLRWGMLVGLPIFMIGAFMVAGSGGAFRADMHATLVAAGAAAEARRARAEGRTKLLVCRGVDLAYGQVQVLFDVDFDVEEGEMVALLGTNGAGKSSLLRAISGTAPPSSGTILFDGRDITQAGAVQTSSLGIVQVPGGRGVFPTMTVGENLRVATWLYRREPEHVEAGVARVLEMFPVLRERFDTPAGNLSGGEQQMLTLAQAFVARPRLLLIDELSLGLAPTVVQQLLEVVRAIHAEGVTIVLVEQSVNVALTVCDRAVFLEKGEVRFQGPTSELLDRPDVLRSVFLEGAAAVTGANGHTGPSPAAEPVAPARTRRRIDHDQLAELGIELPVLLEARGLTKHFGGITAVDEVSLRLHQGEILGLIGSNGAGKTTIFDLLSGFLAPDAGVILLDGIDVTAWTPDQRARARLGRSFQDARLFPALTVTEAIAVALERHVLVPDVLSAAFYLPAARESEDRIADRVDELIELMGLEAFRDKFVAELSTGSRRIVDLACTLAHQPRVVLLDEPSSGIAQRETEALGPVLLRVQRETNTSLLVIEHDMPLISSISDRLVALEAGRQIAEGAPRAVLEDPRVIASYLGTDESVIARSGSRAATNGKRRRRQLVASTGRTRS